MSNPQPNPNQLDPKFQLQAEQKLSINFPHYLKVTPLQNSLSILQFQAIYSIHESLFDSPHHPNGPIPK